MMSNFILLATGVLSLVTFCNARISCNMTVTDADKCAKELMFIGDRESLIPGNDDEMNQYCSRVSNGIKCIRHYAKACLPSFPQQVFGMFAYDAKAMLRKQCRGTKERSEFLSHASCFLPKPYMNPVHECMDNYIIQLNILQESHPDWRIPGVCCTFHLLEKCISDNSKQLCDKKTRPETADYISDIIKGVTNDVMDFICGSYKSLDKCNEKMDKDIWQKMIQIYSSKDLESIRAKHRFFSPMPALVEIITKYEM